jgi:choline dehydrogenase
MSAKGWDYVVIGAGAAGCVVAGRLSQMLPEARIALIEAGRERLGVTTRVPGIAFIASTFPQQNWNYQTEPVPALNGRRLSWFQGRILGGSSSINGMLYLRGHSLEYDQWAQRGCQGWSFDQVLPYFKKAETNSRGAGEWHGDNGPMGVKQSRLDLPICDAFLAAAGEAGYPVVDDLNADVAEGFGRIDTNIANSRRASTAVAFAQSGRQRGNLDLLSEAVAARIVIEGGRAKGVEIIRQGAVRRALGVLKHRNLAGVADAAPFRDRLAFNSGRPVVVCQHRERRRARPVRPVGLNLAADRVEIRDRHVRFALLV